MDVVLIQQTQHRQQMDRSITDTALLDTSRSVSTAAVVASNR